MIIEPIYRIGSFVYSSLPESSVGMVIDISYSFRTKQTQYQVSFSPTINALWYWEFELSETKAFIVNL